MTRYLNTPNLTKQEERIKVKSVAMSEAVTIQLHRKERMLGSFCGLVMFIFLSVFGHAVQGPYVRDSPQTDLV